MIEKSKEQVVTSTTGGQKCSKLERFDLIPSSFLWGLAKVFGKGSQKYADHNWLKGYQWSLSYASLQRHANLFWSGEHIDPESGLHHLLHCAWHCCALFIFSTVARYAEFDDRHSAITDKFDDGPEGVCDTCVKEGAEPLISLDPVVGEYIRVGDAHYPVVYHGEDHGTISGVYYRGTDFTSRIRLMKAGYKDVDDLIASKCKEESCCG